MNDHMLVRPLADTRLVRQVGNTAGLLAATAVQRAKSGHPGAPLGMRILMAALWLNHYRHNPKNTTWCARDRLVLSNGHAVALWYSMLHLAGVLSLDDLKSFRQLGSLTPGHPEYPHTPGIDATTGPLGQGIANAVGMAIAATRLAAIAGHDIFPSRIFCFTGDGCNQEGVSHEAAALAGHHGLGNLFVIYDQNGITIDGSTDLSMRPTEVEERFRAYGWTVLKVDGLDPVAVDAVYRQAFDAPQEAPVIIIARTTIGDGSPKKAGTASAHGEPLGDAELLAVKSAFGFPADDFHVPGEVTAHFAGLGTYLEAAAASWSMKVQAIVASEPGRDPARLFDTSLHPDLLQMLLLAAPGDGKPIATRKLSQLMLGVLARAVPALVSGSADLEPSNLTKPAGATAFSKSNPQGRYFHFGVREFAMGAISNGMALFGGHIPAGGTFLVFSDYMRPAIRVAALSGLRNLFVFTHDSILLGEDGRTHQPIEHLMSLRLIPNLQVLRPASAEETAVAYYLALSRTDGPSAIAFTRQNVQPFPLPAGVEVSSLLRGAYRCYGEVDTPDLLIVASGSEVPLGIETAKLLEGRMKVRVVSMLCGEIYARQDAAYQNGLIPSNVRTLTIEAGRTFGWYDLLGGGPRQVCSVGVDAFGESAPAAQLVEHFGLTPEKVLERLYRAFPDLRG